MISLKSPGRAAAALLALLALPLAAVPDLAQAAPHRAARSAPAKGKPSLAARAKANLASYLSDADYPDAAIRRGEQGTVQFRLDVDATGHVARCIVIGSSGSAILDDATCRIMIERAHFQPARDRRGRAVPDQVTNRTRWVLPDDDNPEAQRVIALLTPWMRCLGEEARRQALGPLPPAEATDKTLAQCSGQEAAATLAGGGLETEARAAIRQTLEDGITRARAAPGGPDGGPNR